MDHNDVRTWLDRYLTAWKSYEPEAIGDLFSKTVSYREYPYAEPLTTRESVVENWLEDRDATGTYDGEYEPIAVDGDVAVARGTSTYVDATGGIASLFYNVFVMRFDDEGRCKEFTEYYSRDPRYGE
jgi:SnoaL-like protein